MYLVLFFFQAEDGIRDLVRSRGLGDVYKRQLQEACRGSRWEQDAKQRARQLTEILAIKNAAQYELSLIHI